MTEAKQKPKANYIFDARNKITNALLNFTKTCSAAEKKKLFEIGIASLNLSNEQLKDTSTDSTYTRYKALTGTIIYEMVQKGSVTLLTQDSPSQKKLIKKPRDTIKQKKEAVKEYLYSKYLTDDEKKDTAPSSKANIVKSILGLKKNKILIEQSSIEEIKNEIELQFKKIAKITDIVEDYPTTPIGNCLRNNNEKHSKLIKGQISEKEYLKSLDVSIIEAINLSGGVNFSRLSLELIKAAYSHNKITNDIVSDGGQDHGIDAELTSEDEFGFVEKIVIQAKTKQSDTSKIGEKITREFIGSMLAAKADKGIFITNVNMHNDAKHIAKAVKNLVCIDKTKLLALIKKYKTGVVEEKGLLMLDKKMFLIE